MKFLLKALFLFTSFFAFTNDSLDKLKVENLENFNLFLESDFTQILLVAGEKREGNSVDFFGVLIEYADYIWFEEVYGDSEGLPALTWISEGKDLIPGDLSQYMIESDLVNNFFWIYEKIDEPSLSFVVFHSPDAVTTIKGFHSQDKPFSITTSNEKVWTSGTFFPIKSLRDLQLWASKNSFTFCQFITSGLSDKYFTAFSENLMDYAIEEGFICNEFFELISAPNVENSFLTNNVQDFVKKGGARKARKD